MVEIPMLDELKQVAARERLGPSPHSWGEPQIGFSTFRFLQDEPQIFGRQLVGKVSVYRVCRVCGSKRTRIADLWRTSDGVLYWELSMITYYYPSKNVYQSECYIREYRCPVCDKIYSKKAEAEKCRQRHLQEIERQKQIQKNFEIIRKLKGSRNRLAQKRIRFAAYRLYRYLDLSPSEIADSIGIGESCVRNWIGQAFEDQCLRSKSCVFKPLLKNAEKTSDEQR